MTQHQTLVEKVVTYSPSWTLIPTHYCRNTCGYCVFVERNGAGAQLLSIAQAQTEIQRARRAGATELLMMSGEGIETATHIRAQLKREGFACYTDYLIALARHALEQNMLPHINVGNLTFNELTALRPVVPSMGMMIETIDGAVRDKAAHRRAPDKEPARRLETLRAAGRARVPFTTGLLVGIGETARAREETLRRIAEIQITYKHIQEVIVQPFTAHAGTAMRNYAPPSFEELRDTVQLAREILPPEVCVQIPPNIALRFVELIEAGAGDLGGVSPDGDRINPQERWLAPKIYAEALAARGFTLRARLAVHQRWIAPEWLSTETMQAVERVTPRLPECKQPQQQGADEFNGNAHTSAQRMRQSLPFDVLM